MKHDVIEIINNLAYLQNVKKFGLLPKSTICTYKYTDSTANGLTKCIIDFLKLSGQQAERISVTGRYSGIRIKSAMQPGSSDISATINGYSVKIEIKIGNDKQSVLQKQYEDEIIKAGGFYFVANSFNQFYDWYCLTFNSDASK